MSDTEEFPEDDWDYKWNRDEHDKQMWKAHRTKGKGKDSTREPTVITKHKGKGKGKGKFKGSFCPDSACSSPYDREGKGYSSFGDVPQDPPYPERQEQGQQPGTTTGSYTCTYTNSAGNSFTVEKGGGYIPSGNRRA